jgi:hypothetical protein
MEKLLFWIDDVSDRIAMIFFVIILVYLTATMPFFREIMCIAKDSTNSFSSPSSFI